MFVWLVTLNADYTVLSFMIGNGVGLYVCYVVIK